MKLPLSHILLLAASCLIFNTVTANIPIPLSEGMVIKTSIQVKAGVYQLNASASLNVPLIIIRGNNITVDFNNAQLKGSNDKAFPNQFYGLAVLVQGNHITIKNAKISGYKIALMAAHCKNLVIENSNFSYNYRQQLQSTWLSEDVSDWMSYHHNEHDEWLRYGAGIYLEDCSKSIIRNNTITGGQCALMMVRSNDGTITNNNFSFNSGIGMGLYRSSRNAILHNRLDFNVRGYSHGIYNRGQDSAGMLLFEQCDDNLVGYNSVTHSGDGFFLWAGQTTMDNGEGGCNDNYLYKNDFSYAPTNGVEVTFSKNHILENSINYCDNGIWGGYSWQTAIVGNEIKHNKTGIAIEHGQNICISNNRFENNSTAAIKLWARKTQPSDWGYAQKKDTRSMGYRILENHFSNEHTALDAVLTKYLTLYKNTYENTQTIFKKDSSVTDIEMEPESIADTTGFTFDAFTKWKDKSIPALPVVAGKQQIRITEWGPYDYRYPLLFLKKIDGNKTYHFDVLGPGNHWKIKNIQDGTASKNEGSFNDSITVTKTGDDLWIEMEYTGPAFTTIFGKPIGNTRGYTFSYRDYTPAMQWNVNWFSWDEAHNPNKNYAAFENLLHTATPVKSEQSNTINYTWWGAIGKQLPADSFATVATTTVTVKKGTYQIGVTADDLVKVFIDGKLVIDFWDASKYVNDEDAHHSAIVALDGTHQIRIEQVENSGYATLIFSLKPL
ncbi:MAG: right-handed parallel beta-helix repeat-containing protein [Bacteroidetes bacterium]|nr:right-handed parallel beta-helix repeat-containing protein [Bacteroidota bacterium]